MRVRRRLFEVAWLLLVASVVLWSDVMPARGAAPAGAERASSSAAPPSESDARRAARDAGCVLFTDRARTATSDDCLGCHRRGASAGQSRACHPVAIDYASASASRASLRPLEEVVRRGVFLPDHELRCVTCHDDRSPWAYAVALPPGSTPTREVDAADPRTYALDQPRPAPAPGDRVSSKPLCLACHVLD